MGEGEVIGMAARLDGGFLFFRIEDGSGYFKTRFLKWGFSLKYFLIENSSHLSILAEYHPATPATWPLPPRET